MVLPYPRQWNKNLLYSTSDIPETLKMVETPYNMNNQNYFITPSSNKTIDTNNVNGWYRYSSYSALQDNKYKDPFSANNIAWISNQITVRLKGVHPDGKDIVVPDDMILSVLDSFWNNEYLDNDVINQQVVLYIVEQIKNDFEITKQNNKLSAWVQTYSMDTGLKQFNGIKLAERRPTHFYSWNY